MASTTSYLRKRAFLTAAIMAVLALTLAVAACGDTPTPTTSGSINNGAVIPGDGGAAAGQQAATTTTTPADPTANYSADEVMSTFVKCYQAGDWNTCKWLFADEVKAGWSSPDELQLNAQANTNERGTLHIIGYGLASDQGVQQDYMVTYYRSKDPQATVPPANQQDSVQFVVKRIGSSWKIDQFYYI